MLQHSGSQKMLGQVFDDTLGKRPRLRAARKLLRDGSALTWLLLFEYMHDQITSHDVPLARSPLRDLTGALRVKALKLLDEPSRHHGEDHASAMRWLQHCITPEDIDLICTQLDIYSEQPDLFAQMCLVAARAVGQFAADRHIDAANRLLHVLLFAPTQTTRPERLIDELVKHAPSLADFYEPLLHASQTCDMHTRSAALQALCEAWPERFLDDLVTFEEEARQQPWLSHDAFLSIASTRHTFMQKRHRTSEVVEHLHDMLETISSPEPPHGDLLEQVSNASRYAPEVILHNALPYLLEQLPQNQKLLLDYIPAIEGAFHSGRLLYHLYTHATAIHLRSKILCASAEISARPYVHGINMGSTIHTDFRHFVEKMWLETLGDTSRLELLDSKTLDALRRALISETYFSSKVLEWLEEAPREFDASALALLSDTARHRNVLAHLAGEHLATRRSEFAAALQALHDRSTYSPLIISLRKLLNAVRKIK